jgi:hypothetical protein
MPTPDMVRITLTLFILILVIGLLDPTPDMVRITLMN